jgi:apolipoprotein N-acyltransferase
MKRPLVLAFAAGLAGVLAFPPVGWWPLAFLSVAGFSVAVDGRTARQGALIGLVFGAGLFGPMLHWTSTFVGAVPWVILAFSQTWYIALLGAIAPRLQALRFGPMWIAAGWVAEEALRDRFPFGGFPWGRWAFSQSASPMKWFVAIGGAPLLTFVVALVGSLLGWAVIGRGSSAGGSSAGGLPGRRPLAGTIPRRVFAIGLAALIVAAGVALAVPLRPGSPARTVTVAAIQGDVPDRGLEFNARRRQVLDNHVTQTLKLAAQIKAGTAPQPDLVLWPENASDIDPTTNPDAAQQIQKAADAIGVPILVGALLDGPGPDHVTNAGIVWMPSNSATPGPGQRYVKRHPVPFGEYIPLRSIARAVSSKVNLVARDMVAGSGNGLLTQTPYPVGDVICFEVAYDSLVRSSVRAGAQLLVIQTNNATFGHSSETYQQLAMSRLRAVEHRRTVVQIATSGKSAIIGPNGAVLQQSGALFTSDILVQNVELQTSTTLATRLGAFPEWLLTALAVLGAGLAVVRSRRHRARSGSLPLGTDREQLDTARVPEETTG